MEARPRQLKPIEQHTDMEHAIVSINRHEVVVEWPAAARRIAPKWVSLDHVYGIRRGSFSL